MNRNVRMRHFRNYYNIKAELYGARGNLGYIYIYSELLAERKQCVTQMYKAGATFIHGKGWLRHKAKNAVFRYIATDLEATPAVAPRIREM